MRLLLNASNEQYSEYLIQQIEQKEQQQTKCNSVYEFRVLQGFDPFYQEEIKAMLLYIKRHKICPTNDDHKYRESDSIIVQKLDNMAVLKSSAIMVESGYIEQIKHFCLSVQMSCLVWDSRLMNSYKTGSHQELISRLNSVDIVIIDGKESSKITGFLANKMQLISLDDELLGLQKLLKLVGDSSYKEQNISSQLDEIRDSLYYLIQRNKDPFLYSPSVNRHFYICPQGMKVTGLAFQRFILVPGQKPLQKPIFSKCSWIFSSLKDGQCYNSISTIPFLKKMEQIGLSYNYNQIAILGYKFLFNQVANKSQLSFEFREYQPKTTLIDLRYKHKSALNYFLDQKQFQVLPFETIQIPLQQDIEESPFPDQVIQLSSVQNSLKKIKHLTIGLGKQLNQNIENIIQQNLNQPCIVCYRNDFRTRFIFGCCGTVISPNCLLNSIKSTGVLKCPSCRFEITDENIDMGFFISIDSNISNNVQYYKDFNHCFRVNRNRNLDSFIYGAGSRMEPGQFISSDNNIKTETCQLFICIDYICPNINHLMIDYQSIQYHIQRIIHLQIGKSNYKSAEVIVYSSNSTIFNYNMWDFNQPNKADLKS